MKKLLAMFLAVTMIFSCSVCSSFATNFVEDVKEDLFNVAFNETDTSWTNKKVLDLTVNELLYFLPLVNGKQEAPKFSMITSPLKSICSYVMPFFSIFIVSNLLQKVSSYYNNFTARKNCGDITSTSDPIEALNLFDTYLFAIKGQEKAKEKMRQILLNIVDENKKRNNSYSNCSHGSRVIYMVGPSGVGKSYSAEILTKVLTGVNSKPYVIEASDIDNDSKVSAVDQLFGMRAKKVSNTEVYEASPLVTQIKSTPEMVVLINEYDKMHTKDLDEKLRTIMDHGYINVNGEKVDCSKTIFIITSNESSSSVNSGNQDLNHAIDDGTGSRTRIFHDKAFLNRIRLVEFENLDKKTYKEIAAIPFTDLVTRYKTEYGLDIDLDDENLEKIAEKVEEMNKGARIISSDFVDKLNDKILNDVIMKGINDQSYKGKKYKVIYNKEIDNYTLELIND